MCGQDPLYLHVRSRCVNSWTVGINLTQPRDTLLICGWQLYCFIRHNEPPLNVTLWDCPNTISPSVCFHYAGVWSQCEGPSGTTGSCQRACVRVQCFGYLSAFIICETHTAAVLLDKIQHLLPQQLLSSCWRCEMQIKFYMCILVCNCKCSFWQQEVPLFTQAQSVCKNSLPWQARLFFCPIFTLLTLMSHEQSEDDGSMLCDHSNWPFMQAR